MSTQDKIFKLIGKVQHYDWGGFDFIPFWLGIENILHRPFAEYWMGAHSSASSALVVENKNCDLHELIKKNPEHFLTKKIKDQFGGLPFLFKILDVREMLSIQVHPAKSEAEKGFELEEEKGIPLSAPHRNYKDKNHKPEMMIALSDFYLLHGFKQKDELKKTLQGIKEFERLIKIFGKGNYKALYEYVMLMPQHKVDTLLFPLVKKETEAKQKNMLTKKDAGWWVAKLFENKAAKNNFDKGIFSIYFFNIVRLEKDEAIFQDAGIPHAYLEGQNIELMASSDNVLRAGLTNKHVDINELMKHILFEGTEPEIIHAEEKNYPEKNYKSIAKDFGIMKIDLEKDDTYTSSSSSMEIFCIMEGTIQINGSNTLQAGKGEAFAILPNEKYQIYADTAATLYKAFVPK